ncbi:MAG: DUF502 domain-containing protein [Salinisphaeraceae bacterium]|nr:DUF502 domain-containing protein [Salinisphaeraceae bacterium]
MIKRWLIAGLLVWLPLGATLLVFRFLVQLMDQSLLLLPPDMRPEYLLGFHIPGLGIVLVLLVLLLTGFFAANIFGARMLEVGESILQRVPLARTVYGGVKQLSQTVLAGGNQSFRKVLLIEYPRKGIWTLAFQTAEPGGEVQDRTQKDVVTVFVPTTPNPTSGFIVLVPRDEVLEMQMTVEEALRMIISLGVVGPEDKQQE